ncbi:MULTISPECIES: hypothetical protein [unclassified Actinomyces]|uniref:hypothetical protein n=1 Tax=unclassified Actinomyces TaxID=2609248 RepID=UPI002017BE8D|nr:MULTISPECIES: hypothetical protein [unclassified Actinomyces]MCL3778624.1 hypothetical protein [Actinomyces sp. AC-20-1]MCL3790893.1 hypothetical protein [Actinomyces sp. 187325]MCL3793148.1 hypothetical protein [Actinomyces sp. 186855]MCL3795503.1 hypothetical protein [Actinomyces sp. 217892]
MSTHAAPTTHAPAAPTGGTGPAPTASARSLTRLVRTDLLIAVLAADAAALVLGLVQLLVQQDGAEGPALATALLSTSPIVLIVAALRCAFGAPVLMASVHAGATRATVLRACARVVALATTAELAYLVPAGAAVLLAAHGGWVLPPLSGHDAALWVLSWALVALGLNLLGLLAAPIGHAMGRWGAALLVAAATAGSLLTGVTGPLEGPARVLACLLPGLETVVLAFDSATRHGLWALVTAPLLLTWLVLRWEPRR